MDYLKKMFSIKLSPSRDAAVMIALATTIPLFLVWYFELPSTYSMMGLAGILMMYFPKGNESAFYKIYTLILCSFGMTLSIAMALFFSINAWVSIVFLGVFSTVASYVINYYQLQPPGNIIILFLAMMALFMPHNLAAIPEMLGSLVIGNTIAILIAAIYCFITSKKYTEEKFNHPTDRNKRVLFVESLVIGLFMMIAMLIGVNSPLQNPYWISIAFLAVVMNNSFTNVWHRSIERTAGTILGALFTFFLIYFLKTPLEIMLAIFVLQVIPVFFIMEYPITLFFTTPLTILMTDSKHLYKISAVEFIESRLLYTLVGCFLGLMAGWLIHQKVRKMKPD